MDKCELDSLVDEFISIRSIMSCDLNPGLLRREEEIEEMLQEDYWGTLVWAWNKANKILAEKEAAYESSVVHDEWESE